MTKWLTIIGMGEDGLDGLSPRARLVLANAEVIVGSKREIAYAPSAKAPAHSMSDARRNVLSPVAFWAPALLGTRSINDSQRAPTRTDTRLL